MNTDLPGIAAIRGHLEMMATVEAADRGRGGFLLDHGCQWPGASLEPGFRIGRPKACFANAQRLVIGSSRPQGRALRYCEGYALSGSIGAPIPIHHGWAVDEAGKVVDVTFSDPVRSVYFGVPFTMQYLSSRLAAGKCGSFLDGDDRGYALLHDRSVAEAALEIGWGAQARSASVMDQAWMKN